MSKSPIGASYLVNSVSPKIDSAAWAATEFPPNLPISFVAASESVLLGLVN